MRKMRGSENLGEGRSYTPDWPRPTRAWTIGSTRRLTRAAQRRLVSPMRELEREPPTDTARVADQPRISLFAIIGPGRVGRSVAAAAERAGIPVRLAGRDDALEACRESEAALLCVPD